MSLTTDDVKNIAYLARLAITPNEVPVYAASLSKIISLVEQLQTADITHVEPMAHPLATQVQRLRADVAEDVGERDKYQANATCVEAGLYLVPKVID